MNWQTPCHDPIDGISPPQMSTSRNRMSEREDDDDDNNDEWIWNEVEEASQGIKAFEGT